MPYPILGVISGFVATAGWFGALIVLEAYWRMREPTVVYCPTAGVPAAVALRGRASSTRVARCSRWSEHEGCSQACLAAGPDACAREAQRQQLCSGETG